MEALYHQTNRGVEEIHGLFARLEATAATQDAANVEHEIQQRLEQLASHCDRLDILVSKEPPTRRQNAKLRVDQLKYDARHLQASLDNLRWRRQEREREQREREQLLEHKFGSEQQDTSIIIDQSLQHHTALQNAHQGLDDMLGSGSSALANMREQRMTLKGAHRRMMDVANVLGLSNTTMRLIERRAYQDKYVLLGGVIVTCIVMFLVVKYLA